MTPLIANARMYAVTPAAETAWRDLLAHVAEMAGVPLAYEAYPAPKPLEELWRRPDLGLAFMCGWPFAKLYPDMIPIAAPIPAAARFAGLPRYATDLVVRADSSYGSLEDTFGGRIGWTVEHSQSGFKALRHHLLAYRSAERPRLYAETVGPLVTARASIQAVLDGRADVGPLDAYWHELLRIHEPETAARLRVIATTGLAPIPLLVSAPGPPAGQVEDLRAALVTLPDTAAGRLLLAPLGLSGFAAVERADYAALEEMAAQAERAGYAVPG